MRVAIVGAGPAGLMAAEVLAAAEAEVTIFEQHPSPGRKLLLAGRSGLNLTHGEPIEVLLDRYGSDRLHLESAIRAFDNEAVQAWCRGLGEAPFEGSSGRVFPKSGRATPLLRAWLTRLEAAGVDLRVRHRWAGWRDGRLDFETPAGPVLVRADATILTCGGPSWPRVGGDGSWRELLEPEGIAVAPFAPSNVGVLVPWTPTLLERHEGEPLKNIAARVGTSSWRRGDLVVTRTGLEGGPVYSLSRELRGAEVPVLTLDLLPDVSGGVLGDRLRRRRQGSTQTSWLRRAGLHPVAISVLRDALGNQLPDDPGLMTQAIKQLPLHTQGLGELDRAISSAGGVGFDALDERFMVRSHPGTFVAGEMLDWEAPTGGYLLQACLSTGVAAARGVVAWNHERPDHGA